MEQDEFVYQYRMGPEIFRFEAHGEGEARKYRQYAILHFQEKLGAKFSEKDLFGPEKIHLAQEIHPPTH